MFELRENLVKKALREGNTSFGIYVSTPSPTIIELAGLAGFDWVRIDWAHAPLNHSIIENMIRAAECRGITPFMRMELDEQKISKVLEMGIMGIIIPDISTAEEAKAAVNAVKFSPIGNRGMFSSPRASGYGVVDGKSFKEWSNNEIMLAIQIESLEGIRNLNEILSVPGIDMILSGRGDLSNALGVTGQRNHPKVLEAEEKIFNLAKSKGLAISPQLNPTDNNLPTIVEDWVKKGAQVITFGHDTTIIQKSFKDILNRIKS